jgi:MATE family multidrug resistance protein
VGRTRDELREVVRLAAPLAAINMGDQLMGFVDTAVVGRLGEAELGATGLGNSVYFTIVVFGLGVLFGLDPLISQAVGAGEERTARRLLWQGFWITLLVGIPTGLLVAVGLGYLTTFGIEARTAGLTADYVYSRLPGLLPLLWFAGARSYMQARSITRPLVVGVVVANVINLPLSWGLVFGDAGLARLGLPAIGLPAMGVAGAGWTTSVCAVVKLLVAMEAIRRLAPAGPDLSRRPSPDLMRRALRLGLPIGLQLTAEVGVFGATAVLAALLGDRALAAHNVALTLASMTFMIPMGIGAAASVRVGIAIGRGDAPGTRAAGLLALLVGGGVMLLTAAAFLLWPRPLAALITNQASIIQMAVPLILLAAVFQVSDGIQAVASGALRGAGDTKWPLYANAVGHYAVGLPIAIYLAFEEGLGARGLWWGLTAGLTAVAIFLTIRFLLLSSRPIHRI